MINLNVSYQGPKEQDPTIPVEVDDIRIIDDNRRNMQLIEAQADENRMKHPEGQPMVKADDLSQVYQGLNNQMRHYVSEVNN